MPDETPAARHAILAALGAITGQSLIETESHLRSIRAPDFEPATSQDLYKITERISTRLGLAPAVTPLAAMRLRKDLRAALREPLPRLTRGELQSWEKLLRSIPESIPTIKRDPVLLPSMPTEHSKLWRTLLELEAHHDFPWVLVGGQMTFLHALENGRNPGRATLDIDIVLGLWTRRDALTTTSRFLRAHGYTERKTSDGYGYRFHENLASHNVIDVLMPEGLHTQNHPPRTSSGRAGFSTAGGNQALTRAERLPIIVDGYEGYVLRPNLLGALVIKAHAYITDSRDNERHCEDILTLASISLRYARAIASDARPADRKVIRKFVRHLDGMGNAHLAHHKDADEIHAFLSRLGDSDRP